MKSSRPTFLCISKYILLYFQICTSEHIIHGANERKNPPYALKNIRLFLHTNSRVKKLPFDKNGSFFLI